MKQCYTIAAMVAMLFAGLFSFESNAQVSHQVDVADFQFDPSQLTINVGDTVIFTNSEGNHNVNGTQEDFPDNPESFGNDVGTGWTYSFVFTLPGTYNYVCDVHPNMTGSITVSPINSVENNPVGGAKVSVYPNPATEFITFDFSETNFNSENVKVTIYNSLGAIVESREIETSEKSTFYTSELKTGMYSFRIQSGNKLIQSGTFMTR
ncbi:T9SS type A sorting domain-containing protein [Halocola ammonii]